jgi:hypothetical protein
MTHSALSAPTSTWRRRVSAQRDKARRLRASASAARRQLRVAHRHDGRNKEGLVANLRDEDHHGASGEAGHERRLLQQ